ncbi:MAG TPA: ABC transporter substrate-binding protein [Pseudothermotoga sp.]|nr:ABC transporter substrate-binding protein [Pseudothermotoga sp.]HPP70285.1 ABC transporter substrate-binding protein [Pseudothermotoga sp.]
MRKIFLGAVVCLIALTVFSAAKVNVSTWGFNLDLLDKNISKPFLEKYGIEIVREVGNNSVRLTKLISQKSNPVIDVVHFVDYYAMLAVKEGLLQPVDTSKLKNYSEIYDFAKDPIGGNYGIGYTVYSMGIVYRTDKIKGPINSWKDFWSKEVAGHISLPDITTTQGPALMMLINQIYDGNAYDPELKTAFEKVRQLKKDVVTFYKTSSELLNLFKMGEVWMAPVQRFSWGQFLDTGLPLAWVTPVEGMPGFLNVISIIKGAKNLEEAYKYIDFMISEEVQYAEAMDLVDSPVNVNVVVPQEIAEKLTYGVDHIKSLIFYKTDFIVENYDKWINKWNELIAQ